jgi:hypothetical protein
MAAAAVAAAVVETAGNNRIIIFVNSPHSRPFFAAELFRVPLLKGK